MKKSLLYVIVCLLLIVVASGTTYIIMKTKDNHKEDNKTETKNPNKALKDNIKLINTNKNNNKITQEYEIILNGKKNNISIDYIISQNNEGFDIKALINDLEIYTYIEDNTKQYSEELIKDNFNEKNFQIIKGTDNKNYLVIRNFYYSYITGNYSAYYIFNDDLKNITDKEKLCVVSDRNAMSFENDKNVYYENSNYRCNVCQVRSKISDNKIYSLIPTEKEGMTFGVLEEREYTINNDKLEYKIVNSYEIKDVAGQME